MKVENQIKGAAVFDAPPSAAIEPKSTRGAGIYDRPVSKRPMALYAGIGIAVLLIALFAIYAFRTYT